MAHTQTTNKASRRKPEDTSSIASSITAVVKNSIPGTRRPEEQNQESHQFKDLSLEFRRTFFISALPRKCIVAVRKTHVKVHSEGSDIVNWAIFSSSQVPSVLHVCKETRQEALRFYQSIFRDSNLIPLDRTVEPFYINPNLGRVFPADGSSLLAFLTDTYRQFELSFIKESHFISIVIEQRFYQRLVIDLQIWGILDTKVGKTKLPHLTTIYCVKARSPAVLDQEMESAEFSDVFDDFTFLLKQADLKHLEAFFGLKVNILGKFPGLSP